MKVLTDYEQLIGKTVVFAHMAQFADQITLVTADGEILMVAPMWTHEEDYEFHVYHEMQAIKVIQEDKYIQEALDRLGVFNLEEWKIERERKERIQREKMRAIKEVKERELYEKLKAKFEGK